jgi:hypothetical protein
MFIHTGMTVRSLIQRLQQLPENLPVVLDVGKVDYFPVDEVNREVVVSQENQVLWDNPDSDIEGERIEAVVLR